MTKQLINVYTFKPGQNQGECVPIGDHLLEVTKYTGNAFAMNGCLSPELKRVEHDVVTINGRTFMVGRWESCPHKLPHVSLPPDFDHQLPPLCHHCNQPLP